MFWPKRQVVAPFTHGNFFFEDSNLKIFVSKFFIFSTCSIEKYFSVILCMLRKIVSNLLPVNFFPTFRSLMNYNSRKRFEKKISSTKKLNFNEPLLHKIFEKIFLFQVRKFFFVSSNRFKFD